MPPASSAVYCDKNKLKRGKAGLTLKPLICIQVWACAYVCSAHCCYIAILSMLGRGACKNVYVRGSDMDLLNDYVKWSSTHLPGLFVI